MFMIDLPESIVNAFVFLQNVFPERKIYLPHEIEKLEINKLITDPENKIIFLTPEQGILIQTIQSTCQSTRIPFKKCHRTPSEII